MTYHLKISLLKDGEEVEARIPVGFGDDEATDARDFFLHCNALVVVGAEDYDWESGR